MTELHQALAERVSGWRTTGYPHNSFPAIAEILLHARNEDGSSRSLREPQIRALETYWYLRLVEGTPHVADLYERCFPRSPTASPPWTWTSRPSRNTGTSSSTGPRRRGSTWSKWTPVGPGW